MMPIATAIAGVGAMQASMSAFKAGGGAAAGAASGAASLTSQAAGKMGLARATSAAKAMFSKSGSPAASAGSAGVGPAAAASTTGAGQSAGTPWAQRAASPNVVNMMKGGQPAIGGGDLASKLRNSIPTGTDGGGGGFSPNVSEDEK
jgi:hypothetical protein